MEKNKKTTITVGIPAYNEESNIGNLIQAVLAQNIGDRIELKEIIVVSDASTDKTAEVAESVNDHRIKVIKKTDREGAYKAQNYICRSTNSDVLVMLNADVMPANKEFLKEIIKPILQDDEVGLTSAGIIPAPPRSIFEKIIVQGCHMKIRVFSQIAKGNNLYNCVGVARAFSRKLYISIRWPEGLPEDAYSYMACLDAGMNFVHAENALLMFRTPSNLTDHIKQSTRFFGGREKMATVFGYNKVEDEYRIPLASLASSVLQSFCNYPLLTIGYIAIATWIKIFLPKNYVARWDIASSTKVALSPPNTR